MSQPLIALAQKRIDNSLMVLQKEISNYSRLENNIYTNIERIRSLSTIRSSHYKDQEDIEILKNANENMRIINQRSLRDIDSIVAFIAGHLSVLLDYCMENYEMSLKIWIRRRLVQLDDMREINVGEIKTYISFPTAVAILSPYLIKTRMGDSETSGRLVTIRQTIHHICELSY